MDSPIEVKICGIKDETGMKAAVESGADYIGFVFVKGSPRHIEPKEAARLVSIYKERMRPHGRKVVAVMADPNDSELAEVLTVLSPDILQLHGKETPERVRAIGGVYDIRLMKAIPVAHEEDLTVAESYIGYADMLLFDAKLEDGTSGGTGKTFDWTLLRKLDIKLPWFLSGGLHSENVAEAIRVSGATRVDVSSGVEQQRGVKDPARIRAFITAAKGSRDDGKA